jgi:MoxR-like ATPase
LPETKNSEVKDAQACLNAIRTEVQRVIVGQEALIEGMLIGLLADGHVLLEGVPGLAKTMTVEALATAVGGRFRRIQFTPDLLPSDLLGTQVYNPKTGEWSIREGPVFGNFVLADEINRAPAKVQSALLQAMEERSISLAGETRPLPAPFLVLATQNPVEQEGTYPLPEAQIDRFMLKLVVGYPNRAEEKLIIERMSKDRDRPVPRAAVTPERLLQVRKLLDDVHTDPRIIDYIIEIVFATREPKEAGLAALKPLIMYGASPRASLALTRASRAHAFLDGRAFVTPHDVKAMAMPILRHRVVTTYEAEAEGQTSESIIDQVLDHVVSP